MITLDNFIDSVLYKRNIKRFTKIEIDFNKLVLIYKYSDCIIYKYNHNNVDYTLYFDMNSNLFTVVSIEILGTEYEILHIELWRYNTNEFKNTNKLILPLVIELNYISY